MREKAKSMYDSGMSLADIAEELGLKPGTLRQWKARYKWDDPVTKRYTVTPVKKMVEKIIEDPRLNDRQEQFCLFFIQSFNATQSYLKAYPDASYATANANARKLLAKPHIKEMINRLKAEKYTRAYLSEDDIFQKYMDIAFSDLGDYVSWGQETVPVIGQFGPVEIKDPDTGHKKMLTQDINVVRFKESDMVDTSLLSEVKQGRDGASIKLQDRMKALEWLADHMDFSTPKQRLELQKLKLEIEQLQGNEDALRKLDEILGGINDVAAE